MRYPAVIFAFAFLLFGCGVKPGSVEPPTEKGENFPRTYPDMATDPDVIDDRDPSPYSLPHQEGFPR